MELCINVVSDLISSGVMSGKNYFSAGLYQKTIVNDLADTVTINIKKYGNSCGNINRFNRNCSQHLR